jgi:hypothetical protein
MADHTAMRFGFSKMIGVGGGGDGGFWVIGADGKLHKIPPMSPEVMRQVTAALQHIPEAVKTLHELGVVTAHA